MDISGYLFVELKKRTPVIAGYEPPSEYALWLDLNTMELKFYDGGQWYKVKMTVDATNIVVSPTPPSDTTLVWLDTTENKLKYFDGTEWKPLADKFGVVISDTAPSGNVLWFDTTLNMLKYYNGTEWVPVFTESFIISPEPVDGKVTFDPNTKAIKYKTADGDVVITKLAVNATAVVASDNEPSETDVLWFDTTEKVLKYFDGTEWKSLTSGSESGTVDLSPVMAFSFFTGLI